MVSGLEAQENKKTHRKNPIIPLGRKKENLFEGSLKKEETWKCINVQFL